MAYTGALLRIVVVLLTVAALYQVLEIWLDEDATRWEAAIAFAAGFVPVVAMQVLLHAVSAPLRAVFPSLGSDYPLSQIDGLSLWYEARLTEESIEDMQNLVSANLVDVILHTRVPVGRLVDWIDQAYLYLSLDRVERSVVANAWARVGRRSEAESSSIKPETGRQGDGGSTSAAGLPDLVSNSVGPRSRAGTQTRTALRQLGIRTANRPAHRLCRTREPHRVSSGGPQGHPRARCSPDRHAGSGSAPRARPRACLELAIARRPSTGAPAAEVLRGLLTAHRPRSPCQRGHGGST